MELIWSSYGKFVDALFIATTRPETMLKKGVDLHHWREVKVVRAGN
jgi:hypothetical protein